MAFHVGVPFVTLITIPISVSRNFSYIISYFKILKIYKKGKFEVFIKLYQNMGNTYARAKNKAKKEDSDFRIVRTHFDSPRRLAVLEVENIDKHNDLYYLTIKDRGLRTVESKVCSRTEADEYVNEWLKKYKCTILNRSDHM